MHWVLPRSRDKLSDNSEIVNFSLNSLLTNENAQILVS